ncbi:2-octaprenyl-6-methoxyphenyl hydroxylase [Vibrio sp.]|nr:2-octaprenyl-6-methoxyphenyl hydroxylase [Vibrio sp.]
MDKVISSSHDAPADFDIVISGGAMTGLMLATVLDYAFGQALSIAVVEAKPYTSSAHPGFDARSIALSFGSVQQLKKYGIWDDDLEQHATLIKHIHVSDQGHFGMTSINRRDIGVEALGYVVELEKVGRLLQKKVEKSTTLTLLCPNEIQQVTQKKQSIHLNVNNRTLSCKLLVAADGSFSSIADKLNIELKKREFSQVAIITNVKFEHHHNGRAFERFTKTGPLALLPMTDGRMSLVWCLEPNEAKHIMSLEADQVMKKLQTSFGWRLGRIKMIGSLFSYPLTQYHRSGITAHRCAIIGNAAQTLHPIAGQGFNLGLRDVLQLVESLSLHLDDVGKYAVLSDYERHRQRDRDSMMTLTSSLVDLFSNDWLAMRIGRNLGLLCVDNIPNLKQPLITKALGLVNK